MTYEKAIKWIDNRLCFGRYTPTIHNPFNKDECYEAGTMAIKALKKQTPKKPKKDGIDRTCPICDCYVGYVDALCNITHNYCTNCGQRIDWSEVKE